MAISPFERGTQTRIKYWPHLQGEVTKRAFVPLTQIMGTRASLCIYTKAYHVVCKDACSQSYTALPLLFRLWCDLVLKLPQNEGKYHKGRTMTSPLERLEQYAFRFLILHLEPFFYIPQLFAMITQLVIAGTYSKACQSPAVVECRPKFWFLARCDCSWTCERWERSAARGRTQR